MRKALRQGGRVLLIGAFCVAGGGEIVAQSGGNTPLGLVSPGASGFSIDAGISYTFSADLDRPDTGDVDVIRYPLRLSYQSPSERPGVFIVNLTYEYSDYDWSDADLFGSAEAFGITGVGIRRIENSNWGLFGLGRVSWAAERNGGSLGRGFSSTLVGGPVYRFTPNFSLTIGALFSSRPERDVRLFPIAAINWRIDDRWSLRTLNGAVLTFVPDEMRRHQIDFSAEFRSRGIRLREQMLPDSSRDRASVEEREIATGIGWTGRVTESITIKMYAEYLFGRKWKFRADEATYRTVEADNNTALIGFQVKHAF